MACVDAYSSNAHLPFLYVFVDGRSATDGLVPRSWTSYHLVHVRYEAKTARARRRNQEEIEEAERKRLRRLEREEKRKEALAKRMDKLRKLVPEEVR